MYHLKSTTTIEKYFFYSIKPPDSILNKEKNNHSQSNHQAKINCSNIKTNHNFS